MPIEQGSAMELLDQIEYQFNNFQYYMRSLITVGHAMENQIGDDQHQEAYITLGTAVLNLVIMTRAVKGGFNKTEEILNLKRSIANRYALTQIAKSLELEKYVFWGQEQKDQQIWLSAQNPLADCLVALLGAIYIDGGLEMASYVFWRLTQFINP